MEYNVTIKLTPEQIKQIIVDHFAKEDKMIDYSNIKFDVETELRDIGDDGWTEIVFKGCSVSFVAFSPP